MITRRHLLRSAAALSAASAVPPSLRAIGKARGNPLAIIPANFIGLGYEMSSAARIGLLSPDNQVYVQLLRNLGPTGVLRLGGIVADFTSYAPDGPTATEPKHTVITRQSLEQLRAFLDRIGWSAIWSVNFGKGTLDEALTEATDVSRILGPRLLALELGNEVENYGHGTSPLRPPPYTFDTYRAEYTRWRAALLAAVPGLRFAAPDTASSVGWVEQMAASAHGDVQLLTTHYYRGDQHLATLDQITRPDPNLEANLRRLRQASVASGLPWRMCETNSFFGGGRPGISDTLAGALWTLDFMLLLAKNGCAGVNLETGVNQLGFISSYSPIQDDIAGGNSAGVPYLGMLAFAQATRDAPAVLSFTLPNDLRVNPSLTAYALGSLTGQLRTLVVINRHPTESAQLPLADLPLRKATVLRLSGPAIGSKSDITFGGAIVPPNGTWTPTTHEPARHSLVVPPASAAVVRST